MRRSLPLLALALLGVAAACRPQFQLRQFTTNEALYQASLREFERRNWSNSIAGFEKLSRDLSPRDTLLPRTYWYLALSHQREGEFLLAAQSFNRLVQTFPEDTLADNAAMESARSYRRLWRRPALDPTYGEASLAAYETMIGLYPTSPLVPEARQEIAELENWFAIKYYDNGMYYFRRRAYDSGNLYFRHVLDEWAGSPTARLAAIRLVQSYQAIQYREDAVEMCAWLRERFPQDRQAQEVCARVEPLPATAGTVSPDGPPTP